MDSFIDREIAYLCGSVFLTQLIFLWARSKNIVHVANNNFLGATWSGTVIHLSWLVSIAIGTNSMHEIITGLDWNHLPVVMSSLAGGILGTYVGMKR